MILWEQFFEYCTYHSRFMLYCCLPISIRKYDGTTRIRAPRYNTGRLHYYHTCDVHVYLPQGNSPPPPHRLSLIALEIGIHQTNVIAITIRNEPCSNRKPKIRHHYERLKPLACLVGLLGVLNVSHRHISISNSTCSMNVILF